jgi:putative redox protein
MKIKLNRKNDAVHFEALSENGNTVQIDGSPAIGGENKGARPMELLLMGLGGCSAIDIVNILKKQRQVIEDFDIEIDGQRQEGAIPSLFESISVHYILKGKLDAEKVRKAIDLSMQKYCSVTKTLEKTANITYSFEIIN